MQVTINRVLIPGMNIVEENKTIICFSLCRDVDLMVDVGTACAWYVLYQKWIKS